MWVSTQSFGDDVFTTISTSDKINPYYSSQNKITINYFVATKQYIVLKNQIVIIINIYIAHFL